MTNYREPGEFGEGCTIPNRRVSDRRQADEPAFVDAVYRAPVTKPEMAVANDDDYIPEPLPVWFDLAIMAGMIALAFIVFGAIFWGLTWH